MRSVFDTQFEALLAQKIDEAMAEYGHTVLSGMCGDYPNYRYEIGRIEGLRVAREMMAEARAILLGGSQKDAA